MMKRGVFLTIVIVGFDKIRLFLIGKVTLVAESFGSKGNLAKAKQVR